MSDPDTPANGTSGGGTTRWVKVFAITLGVLVLAVIAMHLTGLSPMRSH